MLFILHEVCRMTFSNDHFKWKVRLLITVHSSGLCYARQAGCNFGVLGNSQVWSLNWSYIEQNFPVTLFIMLNKLSLIYGCRWNPQVFPFKRCESCWRSAMCHCLLCCTGCFLYFASADEILKCGHSKTSYRRTFLWNYLSVLMKFKFVR